MKVLSGRFRTLCLISGICALLAPHAIAAFGFSPSAPLNSDAATDDNAADEEVSIAADGSGTWIAVWNSNHTLGGTIDDLYHIFFARSTDNGANWSDNALLNSADGGARVVGFQPRVAGDGKGNWVCVWYAGKNIAGNGTDNDIFAAYSTDDGQTWSDTVIVNSNATTDGSSKDEYVSVVTDGKGHWTCVWHSNNDLGTDEIGDYDILTSRSSDNGATWSAVQALNSDAATDTTYDQDPRIETDRAGTWIAVWESENELDDKVGGDGDLLYAISTNNGQTWTENAALNADAAVDFGYETFPSIATDRLGNWVVVWEGNITIGGMASSDYEAMSAYSTDNGATWSMPTAINNDALTDDNYDSEPKVQTDGFGTWIAVWRKDGDDESPFGDDQDIVASKSTDNGKTWTDFDALNASMTTDTGGDVFSVLDTDRDGHWIAAWRSNDSLGDTIGTDSDILTANLTIDVPTIMVTKPNGGERWNIGDKETVEWESTGDAGNKVVIELLKGSNVVETIDNSTKNDGKQKWTVPKSVDTGNGYKVRVYSKSNSNISDESDDKFKIK
ncbi:MAG: exo-alpha-sialidase [Candidatus Hydrogenedentes bacterium]|nr:exo-alpha-sialidase [Candidatus Hydrogenedentota bacterium]